MSILSALIDASLVQDASIAWVNSGVIVSVGKLEKQLFASRPKTAFATDDYIGWGVRTRDNAESAVRSVVFKSGNGTRKTIGCIFPISSLDPDSEYCADRLDSVHEKAFASQAASLLVERGIANDFVRSSFVDLPDESKLSDLFDPAMSVVVLGVPLMQQAGANERLVQLALQKFGYFVSPPREQSDFEQFVSRDAGNRNIENVSSQATAFIPELTRLIAVASRQSSPAAAFLFYYQAIEIFLQERFRSEISRIINDAGMLNDPWILRDKLVEAAGERRRLNALISCCNSADAAAVNSMHDVGRRVLRGAGQDDDVVTKMSASDVLYKVRNLVVHDQKAMPAACNTDFIDFVYSVHQIVFVLIGSFSASIGRIDAFTEMSDLSADPKVHGATGQNESVDLARSDLHSAFFIGARKFIERIKKFGQKQGDEK